MYFLPYLKWETPEENLDLYKQLFLFKPVNTNCFSPQSEPHTAKLCLSFVLKYFGGEFLENFFFLDIKVTISEMSTEILRNLLFLPCLKGGNPEKNMNKFKPLFLIKVLKGDQY